MFEIFDCLLQVIESFERREREIEELEHVIARENEQLAQHSVSVTDLKNRSDVLHAVSQPFAINLLH